MTNYTMTKRSPMMERFNQNFPFETVKWILIAIAMAVTIGWYLKWLEKRDAVLMSIDFCNPPMAIGRNHFAHPIPASCNQDVYQESIQ